MIKHGWCKIYSLVNYLMHKYVDSIHILTVFSEKIIPFAAYKLLFQHIVCHIIDSECLE